jgi:transcriptional regulator with XRE-family HTH domain
MTQEALAKEAGVSLPTVQRIESGRSTQSSNLLRVLRALGLLANLDALVPEPPVSPLKQAKLQGRRRRRASSSRGDDKTPPWSWGDDE